VDNITETNIGASLREVEKRSIPVLDVGPALTGDAQAIQELSEKWRDVWQNLGFMCITNHGISNKLVSEMEEAAKRFHDLPHKVKMKISINAHMKGYTPAHASVATKSKFYKNRKLDTVECLIVATDFADDNPHVISGEQFYGKMPWLSEDIIPGFRLLCEKYMNEVTELGKKLLPVWALSLNLEQDYFKPFFEENYTYFRVAKYPPKAKLEEGEIGVNAHADTGFMTFLPPANEEGLQVLDVNGKWFWPDLPDNSLIVNAGQFLERWTNDRIRATPHRVVPPLNSDRYSLACFVNPNFEATCESLPTCTDLANPPKYETQSYLQFFSWYMTNAFTHYGKFEVVDGKAMEK